MDLFSYDFIFVPIHEALHWSLIVICHPKDDCLILHFDSLLGGWVGGRGGPDVKHIKWVTQGRWYGGPCCTRSTSRRVWGPLPGA